MGVGEVDELLKREEKRRKKRKAKLEARQQRKEKAQTFWRGVAGAFGAGANAKRQEVVVSVVPAGEENLVASEGLTEVSSSLPDAPSARPRSPSSTGISSSASSATFSGVLGKAKSLARYSYGLYLSLRHAHLTAAREQAEENSEKIQQVYGREGVEVSENPSEVGWGLGLYGVRQRRDADDSEREEGLVGILEESRAEGGEEWVDEHEEQETSKVTSTQSDSTGLARRRMWGHGRKDTAADILAHTGGSQSSTANNQPSSMWYWGPLQRWRLQDSTVYS